MDLGISFKLTKEYLAMIRRVVFLTIVGTETGLGRKLILNILFVLPINQSKVLLGKKICPFYAFYEFFF